MVQNELKRESAYEVFISYSPKNKTIVDALCHYLEENKIRCWMAPRDILPGQNYAEAIAQAMSKVKVFILVYSNFSLSSQWVRKETNLAVSKKKIIIPFRIEDCSFEGTTMELYLNDRHWINAVSDPEKAFDLLAELLPSLLDVTPPVSTEKPLASTQVPDKFNDYSQTRNKNFDVFISYRRTTGSNDARLLEQALRARGFNVFFDYNSLRSGKFDESIFTAIEQSPVFILILSEKCFEGCSSETDWVRMEIEHALKIKGKTIIPVAPSDQFWSFPADLPQTLKELSSYQVSELNKRALFDQSITMIIDDRFPTALQRKAAQFQGRYL